MFDNLDPSALIPFAVTTGKRPQLSGARIVEAVIIAGVTAIGATFATMYVQQKVMDERFASQQKMMDERFTGVVNKLDRMELRLEGRLQRLEGDFYIPRGSDSDPPEILKLPPAPSAFADAENGKGAGE